MASPEFYALVEQLRSQPVAPEDAGIEEIRSAFELIAQPVPDDVRLESVEASGVPAQWIIPPNADQERVIYYLHGGGYTIGSINTHRAMVAAIARSAEARALALDYRLAPEHPFPAAVEDATAGYRWLLAQGARPAHIVIAGDSAGGGLTLATLVALRDAGDPLPAAGVCLSPWVDLEGLGDSMTSKADADPIVQKEPMLRMAAAYLGGADPRTPLAAPLYAGLQGLPPLLIQVGTSETLLDDSNRIAERARAAGVDVTLEPWEEMIHVWQLFAGMVPEGREAIDRIGAFIRQPPAPLGAGARSRRVGAASPARPPQLSPRFSRVRTCPPPNLAIL
jgi:monoterpene epsilon-lactone hydrolase